MNNMLLVYDEEVQNMSFPVTRFDPILTLSIKVNRQQPRSVMRRPSLKILSLRKWLVSLSVCMIIEICKQHLVLNTNSNINIIVDI